MLEPAEHDGDIIGSLGKQRELKRGALAEGDTRGLQPRVRVGDILKVRLCCLGHPRQVIEMGADLTARVRPEIWAGSSSLSKSKLTNRMKVGNRAFRDPFGPSKDHAVCT